MKPSRSHQPLTPTTPLISDLFVTVASLHSPCYFFLDYLLNSQTPFLLSSSFLLSPLSLLLPPSFFPLPTHLPCVLCHFIFNLLFGRQGDLCPQLVLDRGDSSCPVAKQFIYRVPRLDPSLWKTDCLLKCRLRAHPWSCFCVGVNMPLPPTILCSSAVDRLPSHCLWSS